MYLDRSRVVLALSLFLVFFLVYPLVGGEHIEDVFSSGGLEVYQIDTLSEFIVYIYYDSAYPGNWISNDDSIFLVRYLRTILQDVGIDVVVVDAENLAQLLMNYSKSILIMSKDIAPSTVWTGGEESLLVKWVRGGGILVWTGDVELWYIGYSNGSKRAVGDLTHLLYDSNIIKFVNVEECRVKIDGVSEISESILPAFSARPVAGGGHVLESYGSCVVGGNKFYDPVMVKAGKGQVIRVFMTGGEVDIVLRAATIAKIVAEKFLGIGIDFLKLRKVSFPRIVIGEYHNWYSTEPSWFHWSWGGPGPKRNPEKIVDDKREIASVNYPLIGPYDSRDGRVIEYHVRIAKASGIDAFAIDWYGPNSYEDLSIEKYLNIAAELDFKIAIQYEPKIRIEWGSGPREYRISMVVADLKYVLTRYTSHPAYLKIDGKPVIFYFWPSQLKLSEWVYIFDKLRTDGFDAVHITEWVDPHLLAVFDCIYEWEPLWIKDANITAWDRLRAISHILREYSRLYPSKCFLAGVWPGFDNEGVYGWGYGTIKYDRIDGRVYEEQWRVVLETNPDMVMVTTFNDWNEGTEIEPSLEYGFKYMNITRIYSQLYKRESITTVYETPFTSITPIIEGDKLKILFKNRGDIVAVRVEVELRDGYYGNFLSYSQPSAKPKALAVIPHIGIENYTLTLVLNKAVTNTTIPVTISYYDVLGRSFEHKLLIIHAVDRTTATTTLTKQESKTFTLTKTTTIVLTERASTTVNQTITSISSSPILIFIGLVTIVAILSTLITYILIREKRRWET